MRGRGESVNQPGGQMYCEDGFGLSGGGGGKREVAKAVDGAKDINGFIGEEGTSAS